MPVQTLNDDWRDRDGTEEEVGLLGHMKSKAAGWPRGRRQPHTGAPDGLCVCPRSRSCLSSPWSMPSVPGGGGSFSENTAVRARTAPGGRGPGHPPGVALSASLSASEQSEGQGTDTRRWLVAHLFCHTRML